MTYYVYFANLECSSNFKRRVYPVQCATYTVAAYVQIRKVCSCSKQTSSIEDQNVKVVSPLDAAASIVVCSESVQVECASRVHQIRICAAKVCNSEWYNI